MSMIQDLKYQISMRKIVLCLTSLVVSTKLASPKRGARNSLAVMVAENLLLSYFVPSNK